MAPKSFRQAATVFPMQGHRLVLLWICIFLLVARRLYADKAPADERPLYGRFLHITDFHPDPFYEIHSSIEKGSACHRGKGRSGYYGAEKSNCDSPLSLVNATFAWIEENLKESIDFVIWTGDSARHDNDEIILRTKDQLIDQNRLLVSKFYEVFGRPENADDPDPSNDFTIPIVPTIGNNDVLPHNVFRPGPNAWSKIYYDIWRHFVPEFQRHQFEFGGWFYVEVIPNRLAVFSLNTMYFFDRNGAVDGCMKKSEPGFDHMEWLRVQLGFMRQRGLKVMLIGHVPPARTDEKDNWVESCWQKYVLWLEQYRDIIVGTFYGHMNLDHFILQDFKDVSIKDRARTSAELDDYVSVQSAGEYLLDLRDDWSKLPKNPAEEILRDKETESFLDMFSSLLFRRDKHKKNKGRLDRYLDNIGGRWAERYAVSLVNPSVIPNYYPTLRVYEYNLSSVDQGHAYRTQAISSQGEQLILQATETYGNDGLESDSDDEDVESIELQEEVMTEKHGSDKRKKDDKGEKKKKKKKKRPSFTIPNPPPHGAPPGPAYSPQAFTLLGYRQYYANLTELNKHHPGDCDVAGAVEDAIDNAVFGTENANGTKINKNCHHHKDDEREIQARNFTFELEYDSRDDGMLGLKDLTVRSYLGLAERIGRFVSDNDDYDDGLIDDKEAENELSLNRYQIPMQLDSGGGIIDQKHKKKHRKHRKHRKNDEDDRVWFTFVKRAFVGTVDEDEIEKRYG